MTDRPPSIAELALARNLARPRPPTQEFIASELVKCAADPVYFINTYCFIYDNATSRWIRFELWPAQIEVVQKVMESKYTVVLKARQEGLSWLLGDCLPLWFMLFRPIAQVLIFSQQEREAFKLLERMKGVEGTDDSTFKKLPDWMKPEVIVDNAHEFRLANGSGAQALPGSAGGRSNAATYVVTDESDYVTNFASLVTAAKPTIDAGANKMVALSTANIETPNSYFQRLYKTAKLGKTESETDQHKWTPIFLPWYAHPGRTREWYDSICRSAMQTEGTLDNVYKEYPETDLQALSARSLNKRFPPQWLTQVAAERRPILPLPPDAPSFGSLRLYVLPQPGRRYGIGLDPAGGLADGDDAVSCVIDAETLEQCAVIAGKIEPTTMADQTADLSIYYNNAPILFELNNHGHAVLSQLKYRNARMRPGMRRNGTSGDPGWLTTERSKGMLYDVGAKVMQEIVFEADTTGIDAIPIIFDATTMAQLSSIDVSKLEAPEGEHDDHAMAWVLGQMAVYRGVPSMTQQSYTGLYSGRDTPREGHPQHPVMAQSMQPMGLPVPPEVIRQAAADLLDQHRETPTDYETLYQEMVMRVRFRGGR